MIFRDHNETEEDLRREGEAKEILVRATGLGCEKLSPTLYHVDWVFSRGKAIYSFGEFKWRDKQYPTVILSLAKWIKGAELAAVTRTKFHFFVQWDGIDGIWAADVTTRLDGVIEMGGNSRGQPGDFEPVIHVPLKDFKRIKGT